MDTDLSSAERRWQRRALFHTHRPQRWRWGYTLLIVGTLAAFLWLLLQDHGIDAVVNQVGALYSDVAGGSTTL